MPIKEVQHNKITLLFTATILVLCTYSSGCIESSDLSSFFDKELRRAQPYIEKVVFDDPDLLSYALTLCKNCSFADTEEIINTLYRHIVEEYTYFSDPDEEELIRTPQQTISAGGGDCEDLSILLMSLLENLGVKTYLVLTPDHAYALAYDVNVDNLWMYVEQSLIEQVEKDSGENLRQIYSDTFILKKRQVWYYGGEGDLMNQSQSFDYINITYEITSDRPISYYVVPSKQDFHEYADDKSFTYYPDHHEDDITSSSGISSYMDSYGGIILDNPSWFNTEVSVKFEFYSHPSFYKLFENETIRSYIINDISCVVLEPTAGPYGYPGYDANVTGKKTAIDPLTKEYFFLQ
jgi:hypothetical protein